MQEQERISSDGNVHDFQRLKELQALPLERKIGITQARIMEFYREFDGKVYVSFSGGKDSTVLLDITRKLFPEVEAVFVDTGLEYPEIREFVKTFENVMWLKPEMKFNEVIEKYGYPVISKNISQGISEIRTTKSDKLKQIRMGIGEYKDSIGKVSKKWMFLLNSPFKISNKCCYIMKKHPLSKIKNKFPIVGTMTDESKQRKTTWIKYGCNNFSKKIPQSSPLSFWTEQDILKYLYEFKISYSSIYGDIVLEDDKYKTTKEKRTGCMFCMYGIQYDTCPNRFQRMKETHPKIYDYCVRDVKDNGLGIGKVLDFIGIKY